VKIRASSSYPASLCPGSVPAQEGLPDYRDTDEVRDSGNRIHAADAGLPVDPPLTDEEQDSLESIRAKRAKLVEQFSEGFELMKEFRETLFETKFYTGHPDLVQIWKAVDREFYRGLIFDSKTGFREQSAPQVNKQLAVYTYALFVSEKQYQLDEVVAGLVPSRFKTPLPVLYRRSDLTDLQADLLQISNAAHDPEAKRIPSPDACRYCRARATDRCPETIPTNTQLFKTPMSASLMASLTPLQKGQLLDECDVLAANIAMARVRLQQELEANPEAVIGYRIGFTRGKSGIEDAQKAFQVASPYLSGEEFAATCKPLKGKLEKAIRGKLKALPEPVKGKQADEVLKALLAPITVKGEGSPKLEKIGANLLEEEEES